MIPGKVKVSEFVSSIRGRVEIRAVCESFA
jgi:hypothetical protein